MADTIYLGLWHGILFIDAVLLMVVLIKEISKKN
jgi:hypothetical protein